jgi:MFS transporter, DHA1 family, tetracycline resistance protein
MPLLPLYADQFAADPTGVTIGLLMASFSIMQFIFAPIWGSLSDRVGRRPVILLGLSGSVLFYALFGLATMYQSLTGLFITRIGAGVAAATIPTAQAYIADSTTHENRARGMALIGVAFGLGFTLGPLFAFFAVSEDGKGTPGASPGFIAAGLSAVALLLAIFRLPESLRPDSSFAARRWWDRSAWRTAFGNRAIAYLLIGFFICIFSFANFETTLSLLIKGSESFEQAPFQFTYRQVCLTFAAIGFLVAVVQGGIVRRLAKRVPERVLAIAGACIEVVGFTMLAFAVQQASVNGLFGALIVIVAGYSCLQPSLYSLLSRWTDSSQQGQVLGIGQSVSALARIFGSGLGIPLLKAQILLPYLLSALLMFALALFVHLAARIGKDATK